ncbi:amino acid permease [Neolewinella antarctica]|uniref:Amino acid transporter n=1 Tax=Neolewinella antarctica TaxID=442734 RepID=A0ABX0XIB4_9BACT|nr:amino acid permease [Neolewinella antarctica]NJC28503.1 amino acid transporter [Neolewinella antarctica]
MKKFGTFGGVFTPTLLTILGVIMYLRLGWVVGNAGLLGAWLIIILAFLITLCTALSMSSITTNTRIGAGGAYAIISQALGLEVGGSLGIPRYVSQGLAVTMYIFGFREGWLSIFPNHHAFAVDLLVFVLLYAIAYKSAELAIKTQFIIMGVIGLSLFSIALAAGFGSMQYGTAEVARFGTYAGVAAEGSEKFWLVFAVFFPASTGIMAGANMSGELEDPRRSIPAGTLWAVGISFVIYMVLAFWIARSATEAELIGNYNIMIDRAFFPPLIIAGVLGATFSSALASIIGSSRILFAMGQHRVLPQGEWLEYQDEAGQPRNAMIVTGVLIFATMLLRDLNAVAPLVTMFFLITYAMLNIVVIIEQRLGLISFRPQFTVHPVIPYVGLIGSLLIMFIINPTISLVSWALMIFVYGVLSRRKLETKFEDVRSGLFTSFAEWAAKHTAENAHQQERSWKPNLLVPVTDGAAVQGSFSLIRDIAYPKGGAVLMGIGDGRKGLLNNKLEYLAKAFRQENVFSSVAMMRTDSFASGVNLGNQALTASFFRPNIVFLNMLEGTESVADFPQVIAEARRLELGAVLYAPHPRAMLGQQQMINVWLRPQGPNWQVITAAHQTQDLALLLSYKLKLNWKASVRIITVIDNPDEKTKARRYLKNVIDLARLPIDEFLVIEGDFAVETARPPAADINLFGMSPGQTIESYRQLAERADTSCLFILDSGHENIFA